MSTNAAAVSALVAILNTGDVAAARTFAHENADALTCLRAGPGLVDVAMACNRWGAPLVWPWGDAPKPNAAQRRLLVNLRSGAQGWRCSEDTVAVCLAAGWVRRGADGRLAAV